MAKRRVNGEGCWGKTKKGKYTYYYYKDIYGSFTYGKTQEEVKCKLKEKLDANPERQDDLSIKEIGVSKTTTLNEYFDYWIKERQEDLEQSTIESYVNAYNKRISKTIGKYEINAITTTLVQQTLNALSKKYSRNTILKTWTPLKMCLIEAFSTGEIERNIVEGIRIPKETSCANPTKIIEVIDENHIPLIYNEAYRTFNNGRNVYGDAARINVLIMYTGLRVSEALGLTWSCVNFDKKTLVIRQSLTEIHDEEGKRVRKIKDTKRKSSNRTVPLPDNAVKILREFKASHQGFTDPNDYVCLTSNGTTYTRRQIERALSNMLKALQINENYTPHSLRHGYGSILLSNGVDIKTVSELLGHKNVQTTMDIYIKIYDKDKQKAVNIFNTL